MPVVALLDGLRIEMYFGDHAPPHIHAKQAEYEVLIGCNSKLFTVKNLPTN
jgi:hypothetical protein